MWHGKGLRNLSWQVRWKFRLDEPVSIKETEGPKSDKMWCMFLKKQPHSSDKPETKALCSCQELLTSQKPLKYSKSADCVVCQCTRKFFTESTLDSIQNPQDNNCHHLFDEIDRFHGYITIAICLEQH